MRRCNILGVVGGDSRASSLGRLSFSGRRRDADGLARGEARVGPSARSPSTRISAGAAEFLEHALGEPGVVAAEPAVEADMSASSAVTSRVVAGMWGWPRGRGVAGFSGSGGRVAIGVGCV